MREIQQSAGDDRQAAMQKIQALRKETNTKVMALMTDDQKKTWKEMTGEPFEIVPSSSSAAADRAARSHLESPRGPARTIVRAGPSFISMARSGMDYGAAPIDYKTGRSTLTSKGLPMIRAGCLALMAMGMFAASAGALASAQVRGGMVGGFGGLTSS